jgi:hypothetical protein
MSIMLRALSVGGFYQYLAQCECGSQQLIASAEHLGTKLPTAFASAP